MEPPINRSNFITLSTRLQAVAGLLSANVVLVDVGTDHGRLPVALLQHGVIQRAIAIDRAVKPLRQAQELAQREGLTAPHFTTILQDGLGNLPLTPDMEIVIAGMGAHSIIQILQQAPKNLSSVSRLILQPNKNVDILRGWLWENGWGIVDERLVAENRQFYVMLAVAYQQGHCSGTMRQRLLGPVLLQQQPADWKKWLAHRSDVLHGILEVLGDQGPRHYVEERRWIYQLLHELEQQ